jgi:uncharacterized membrane protein
MVEMVEALTIVLAVGITGGWRSPLYGAAGATLVLAALIALLGPASDWPPEPPLLLSYWSHSPESCFAPR